MEENYEVRFGEKTVGRVRVQREGLYLRFVCRCGLTGDVVCRLSVSCGGKDTHLGVLVPVGDGFGLETRLPAKRLGQGEMVFQILPNRGAGTGKFVPISPEEPFQYISRLKEAYLQRRDGQLGAVFPE